MSHATVTLRALTGGLEYSAETSSSGEFVFASIQPGGYALTVTSAGKTWKAANPIAVANATMPLTADLDLWEKDQDLIVLAKRERRCRAGEWRGNSLEPQSVRVAAERA